MKNIIFNKTDIKVYLSLLFYATAILFVISPDSYTQGLLSHIDSAWFFMCGKAWMNGMIPYVDFADSKGLLLWLITGVGYLISHYDYIGVFWLACLWYSVTFFICYKIGTLLTQSRRKGYVVALLMAFPYFCFFFHYETRAEDWCQPFIAASLYWLLKLTLRPLGKSARTAGVVFGVAFMATLLIKWSIAVMTLGFVASGFLFLLHRKLSAVGYCFGFCVAATAVFLPFLLYMIATDSFGAFVREYFLNTGQTVSGGGLLAFIKGYCKDIIILFLPYYVNRIGRPFYVLYIAAIFFYYRKHKEITAFPLLCGLFFLAIAVKHDYWNYYVNAVSTFAIFLAVIIAEHFLCKDVLTTKRLVAIYVSAMVLNFANVVRGIRKGNMFFQDKGRKEFYNAAFLMSQLKNPKIMNSSHEIGFGMPSNTLPSTLYWSRQNGATETMDESRWKAVAGHKPDFITVALTDTLLKEKVVAAGYQYYMALPVVWRDLYGRPGLKLPPKDCKVTDMDILLKRKIKFADED